MTDQAILIFSGYNPRAVIAFIRTLEKADVAYGIIERAGYDEIADTNYKSKVLVKRKDNSLNTESITEAINAAKQKLPAKRYLIAPSTEALNRFAIENTDLFKDLGCEVPLVSSKLYTQVSDKQAFSELCSQHSLTVPKELSDSGQINFPIVAKPKTYFDSQGQPNSPELINTQSEFDIYFESKKPADYYLQEYVIGQSFYLLYYFYKNGEFAKFSQINLAQQPDGKSIVAARPADIHTLPVSTGYEKLFKQLDFRGLVMVEVKQSGDQYYMIEANPRFWGPSQLFVDCQVNFFEAFLFDNGFLPDKPDLNNGQPLKPDARYFWYGGILQAKSEGKQLTYYGFSEAELQQTFSDWLPWDVYNRQDTKGLFKQD